MQLRIDHHPQGLTRGFNFAHIHLRIVRQHRTDTGKNSARTRAPLLHILTRRRAGDPLRYAVIQRSLAIQTRRRFQPHPGPAARHARDEADIQLARRLLHQAAFDRHPRLLQAREPTACDLRIRVAHGRYDAHHPRRNQRIGTGRCAPLMRTRFERHIHRRAARLLASLLQGVHFGMRRTGALMPAFAYHFSIAHNDAADARIGAGAIEPLLCQTQCLGHEAMVGGREHGGRRRYFAALVVLGTALATGLARLVLLSISCSTSRKSAASWKLRYTEAKRM